MTYSMERDKIVPIALSLLVTILVVLPQMQCQLGPRTLPLPLPPPRPLCVSQFTLVNYACAVLPYSPAPPVSPPSPPSPPPPHHPHPPPKHPHHDGGGDDDNDNDNSSNADELEHSDGHRHGHRHHRYTPEEENCCRWLKDVDSECVCDLLVRLPVFLSRPVQEYSVIVDGTCNVTYSCNGRLRP